MKSGENGNDDDVAEIGWGEVERGEKKQKGRRKSGDGKNGGRGKIDREIGRRECEGHIMRERERMKQPWSCPTA